MSDQNIRNAELMFSPEYDQTWNVMMVALIGRAKRGFKPLSDFFDSDEVDYDGILYDDTDGMYQDDGLYFPVLSVVKPNDKGFPSSASPDQPVKTVVGPYFFDENGCNDHTAYVRFDRGRTDGQQLVINLMNENMALAASTDDKGNLNAFGIVTP